MDMAWNVSSVEGLRIQFAHGSLPVIVAMELFISQVTLVLFKIISSQCTPIVNENSSLKQFKLFEGNNKIKQEGPI